MQAYHPYSHSPRVSDAASPRIQAGNPTTPVHSPHHSVTSSVSSRTPLHTLTIHEYRKQQHTPNSQKGTPNGRTLRRKAAASTLNDIERAPSVTHSTRSDSDSSLRPLHFSRSAYQLLPVNPQQALLDLSLRSQSAEPRVLTGSVSSISTANSSGKVRNFNSRKRLPRPPVATGPVLSPPPFANVKTTQSWRSPPTAASRYHAERSRSTEAHTTPTPSTFSLSQFPQPPPLINPSFSLPYDEKESTSINALGFTTNAPATPPTTPAIIHYRGASFDLVNPHDSLLLHDIVTPSRDFDSSEFLSLRASDEPFVISSEMAPKRALYGDFGAAHAGILRRAGDSLDSADFDLPLAPMPAAISPNSSSYTSPMYSPESVNAPSPLVVSRPTNDSRFSLKQLTRSLTKKLNKSPAKSQEEELQEMHGRAAGSTSVNMDRGYARPFDQGLVAAPQASYFPLSPVSPTTPTRPTFPEPVHALSPSSENGEVGLGSNETDRYKAKPLASMIPDEPSTQMGRLDENDQPLPEEGELFSRPYYDDLDSIYPSSSIYTGDDRRKSNYQQSLASNRQSNPFVRYSNMDADSFANEYNRDSLHGCRSFDKATHRMTRPFNQDMYHCSLDNGDVKTDTISKLIDEYRPEAIEDAFLPTRNEQIANYNGVVASRSGVPQETSMDDEPYHQDRVISGLSQFEFELRQDAQRHRHLIAPSQSVLAKRPTIAQDVGFPPRSVPPRVPTFGYEEAAFYPPLPGMSGMFSNMSSYSYGDTQNLLQLPQSEAAAPPSLAMTLEPSSSYSQPEVKPLEPSSSYSQAEGKHSPQTPKEALDQAEKIFKDVVDKNRQSDDTIPAMWARRNSATQLLSKIMTNQSLATAQDIGAEEVVAGEKADWETIGGNSREGRGSQDSIADYSSSEGTQNSLGLDSDGSPPYWAKRDHHRGPSRHYSHPSPLRSQHSHPFSSSPPSIQSRAGVRTAPGSSSPPSFSPPTSRTVPVFRFSTHPENVLGRGAVEQPYAFAPWADPYAFSDKETQELLASGPNDNILIENEPSTIQPSKPINYKSGAHDMVPISTSDASIFDSSPIGLERENTFEKLCLVGPKGNLTGTPRGSRMHETGSSVADTSSPGLRLSSNVGRQSLRSDYTGFYASPYPASGSVTRIRQAQPTRNSEHDRTPSEVTLFPRAGGLESVQESSPLPGASHHRHVRNSTTFQRTARRTSRSAVPGQTKLRQMFLAPDGRSTNSTQNTRMSQFMGGSERPSTSDTNTPLHPSHLSIPKYPDTTRIAIAHEHSPHLLCVERESNPEDEARRRKLSWFILAAFCILPPCIILFRFLGDPVISSLTEGRLGHCTARSKRTALIAGIAVNVGLVTVILVPILVAHALKAV